MTSAETIAALRNRAADIRAHGVTALYVFGSTARGEAAPESDVDLFVDYDPEPSTSCTSSGCARSCRAHSAGRRT